MTRCDCGQYRDVCARYGHRTNETPEMVDALARLRGAVAAANAAVTAVTAAGLPPDILVDVTVGRDYLSDALDFLDPERC